MTILTYIRNINGYKQYIGTGQIIEITEDIEKILLKTIPSNN